MVHTSFAALLVMLAGCATPKMKAACGPLNAYAADECGEAMQANAAFDAALKR